VHTLNAANSIHFLIMLSTPFKIYDFLASAIRTLQLATDNQAFSISKLPMNPFVVLIGMNFDYFARARCKFVN